MAVGLASLSVIYSSLALKPNLMSTSHRPSALSKGSSRSQDSTAPSSREPKRVHWSDPLEVVEGSQRQMTAQEKYRTNLPKDITVLFESGTRDPQLGTMAKTVCDLLRLDNTEEVI